MSDTVPYVKRKRFATPFPSVEVFNSLKTFNEKHRALEEHQALLKKFKWKIIPAHKVPSIILSLNCQPSLDRDGKPYFPNLKKWYPGKSASLVYPKNMSQGELQGIALPTYLEPGNAYEKVAIQIPSQLIAGNQYEHELVYVLVVQAEGSVDHSAIDVGDIKFQKPVEKPPYRAGSFAEQNKPVTDDSAISNGGIIPVEEETNLIEG